MALEKLLNDYRKALSRLEISYEKARNSKGTEDYEFFRDSAIQRFEFSVEVMWKLIKKFLEVKHGIVCRSPKGCIREFFSVGLISQEETVQLFRMIDDRNRTSHTYHEEVAEEIFSNLSSHIELMRKILKIISKA